MASTTVVSPWRWPTASRSNSPKGYGLQHTVSMTNLHGDDNWGIPRAPPSPDNSSTTTATARSVTPTRTNPWASSTTTLSSPTRGSPKSRTPPETSRSSTPIAPRPIRPFNVTLPTPRSSPPNSFYSQSTLDLTTSPTSGGYKETPSIALLASLPTALITPALISQLKLSFPSVLSRQRWERSTSQRAYMWALQNPRTALLLLMLDDLPSWPRAVIYGLEDSMLPYKEGDLFGIASDAEKAIAMQWRVMVKDISPNGQHYELQRNEYPPLEVVKTLQTGDPETERLEQVRFLGHRDDRVFMRKTLVFGHPLQKTTIMGQIQAFKKLDHPNIAKFSCTYAKGSDISFLTLLAQYSLQDYLRLPLDAQKPGLLLDWLSDLAQALSFIHQNEMQHKSVRPTKILIDGTRIYFSAFGIFPDAASALSANSRGFTRQLSEYEAMYLAPEVINRRKHGRPSDVFALGCVFLEMLTAVKRRPIQDFTEFRAQGNSAGDISYQANLERVFPWMRQLNTQNTVQQQARFRAQPKGATFVEHQALSFIAGMMAAEPNKRPKMRHLVQHIQNWNEGRALQRRRSFDARNAATAESTYGSVYGNPNTTVNDLRWGELRDLDGYYSRSTERRGPWD